MRVVIALVVGVAGGFALGLVLSQVIAVVGLLLFDQLVGIKFLPIYLAIAGAVIAPLVEARNRRRAQ